MKEDRKQRQQHRVKVKRWENIMKYKIKIIT